MRVRTPRYDAQNDEANMAFRSPARRSRSLARGEFSQQRRRKGSTSTETSGDEARRIDERKFDRRAVKSMDKARRRFLPLNIEGGEAVRGVLGERIRAANLAGGSSCADIDPMSIDRSVTFESVGGERPVVSYRRVHFIVKVFRAMCTRSKRWYSSHYSIRKCSTSSQ